MIVSHPSYDLINQGLKQIVEEMDSVGYRPTKIIGLARGGLIPAVILSQSLGIPMQAVHYSSKSGKGDDRNHDNLLHEVDVAGERILIIDDIVDSGNTFEEVFKFYKPHAADVRTAALYWKETSVHTPHHHWHALPADAPFIIFPWERDIKYLNL